MGTKKFFWIAVAMGIVFSIGTVAVQAAPIQFSEQNSLNSNWESLKTYSFLEDVVLLAPGQYDLIFDLKGIVWQGSKDSYGWEPTDEIFIEAYLNDTLLASFTGSGLDGQDQTFDFSLSLIFELETDGKLEINVLSDASSSREIWKLLDANLSGDGSGAAPVNAVPVPTTLILLGSGLIGLIVIRRKER